MGYDFKIEGEIGEIEVISSPHERIYELDFLNNVGADTPASDRPLYGLNKELCKDVADIIKRIIRSTRNIENTLNSIDGEVNCATINTYLILALEFRKTSGTKFLKELFKRHSKLQNLFVSMLYHYYITDGVNYKNFLNHMARSKAMQVVMYGKNREPELYDRYCRIKDIEGKRVLRPSKTAARGKVKPARAPKPEKKMPRSKSGVKPAAAEAIRVEGERLFKPKAGRVRLMP